ncbi:hypothetical protein DEJ33_01345 [Curtobacterium sp. MCPF17_047]|uniref:DUF6197 family protein n=1 Tax=unclassified Curtobacterium TaxID=257496 RepID=UPI000DA82682|nr:MULTISPECIES: hypothetical protein [unclassified Curtobacterium]PZF15454.1 hypothetical protein DEJ25_01615 [Curtobacterium sp. MCPF17_011]PZF69037.1 hypothetical protein DEJ33_01345 [Curtobacterium sp. MCPF17_047]
MTLEFRVQHDVATDASPSSRTAPRGRVRRVLDHLAARRTAAQLRRLDADLVELSDLQRVLSDARAVVDRGWIQHAWFAYVDDRGRTRTASSAAATEVAGRPLVGACLVGAVVDAAGGPHAVHSQPVQRSLDLVWHALAAAEGSPVTWCPAPDIRMGRVRDLTRWNDSAGRTAEQVSGLLLTAERVALQESDRVAGRASALRAHSGAVPVLG